jgi:hypothetical protein
MFRQPVAKERVRDADGDRAVLVSDERGRPKPRREAVAVYLSLDAGKDLVPDIRRRCCHAAVTFAPAGAKTRDFPHLFPQLWKSWGETLCGSSKERRHSSTGERG